MSGETVVRPGPRAQRVGRLLDVAAGVPIVGFTGINGAGKTMLAVTSALADMAGGARVFSTVQIDHPVYGRSTPLVSLRQLLTLPRGSTILLDDVSVIFSNRGTQSVPPEVVTLIQTLRHKEQRVLWTAPGWMRVDVQLRLVTQACVNVVPLVRRRVGKSPWPQTRAGIAGLLDTTDGKPDATPTKVLRRRLFRVRGLAGFGSYDTLADTPLIGGHVEGGVCPDCGGSRTRPKHSLERHQALGLPWFGDDELLARPRSAVTFEGVEDRGSHGGLDDDPEQRRADDYENEQPQQSAEVEYAAVSEVDVHGPTVSDWHS